MKKQFQSSSDITFWVNVPLTFTYRTTSAGKVIETDSRIIDLPILHSHLKDVKTLVKQSKISPEQALENLILEQIKVKEKEYNQQEPSNHLTITISGELTYDRKLLTRS
jgi:hypothetical protein